MFCGIVLGEFFIYIGFVIWFGSLRVVCVVVFICVCNVLVLFVFCYCVLCMDGSLGGFVWGFDVKECFFVWEVVVC